MLLGILAILATSMAVATPVPAVVDSTTRPRLPLFRAPNATEAAAAAGGRIVWSAHQPMDSLRIVSDPAAVTLACLLDDGGDTSGAVASHLELSWTVSDSASHSAAVRHTLSGSTAGKQTFSLDLGSGLQPATGVFDSFTGSFLNVAFPAPSTRTLSVGCEIRLSGAAAFVRSPRLRFWDERLPIAALTSSRSANLLCLRTMHRQPATLALSAATLDCEAPAGITPGASLLMESAVYGLHPVPTGSSCEDTSLLPPKLLSNSTDPAVFYALHFDGRLRIGWALEGDGAALQKRLDASGGDLCVTAEAPVPSESRRHLQLQWRVRLLSTIERNNSNIIGDAVGNTEIKIDWLHDPPLPRSLPCPYLCQDPILLPCLFAWLHSKSTTPGAVYAPPDPSLEVLMRSHSLLLLPWLSAGNPGPPPLAGSWTCRRAGVGVNQPGAVAVSTGPEFRVTVAARPTLCGRKMPARSVVFVGRNDSSRSSLQTQSLAINCSICGVDSSVVDAQLTLVGSVGGVDADVERTSERLAGGGLELGMRFRRFRTVGRINSAGGSILLRCNAFDSLGRGSVAYSAIDVLTVPATAGARLDTDCQTDQNPSEGECRRFRCPLDPALAAAIRGLQLSVAFLFTLQPDDAAPPQQVLVPTDRLRAETRVSKLRCTQLLYYTDHHHGKDAAKSGEEAWATSRQQGFATAADPVTVTELRAALGESRFSRLVLTVDSGWLEIQTVPIDVPDGKRIAQNTRAGAPTKGKAPSKTSPKKKQEDESGIDMVDVVVGLLLAVSLSVAIFFLVTQYREQVRKVCKCIPPAAEKGAEKGDAKDGKEPPPGATTAPGAAAAAAQTEASEGKKKGGKKEDEDEDSKKKKKKGKKGDEEDEDEGGSKKKKNKGKKDAEEDDDEDAGGGKKKKKKKEKKKKKKKKDDDDDEPSARHNVVTVSQVMQLTPPRTVQFGILSSSESTAVNLGAVSTFTMPEASPAVMTWALSTSSNSGSVGSSGTATPTAAVQRPPQVTVALDILDYVHDLPVDSAGSSVRIGSTSRAVRLDRLGRPDPRVLGAAITVMNVDDTASSDGDIIAELNSRDGCCELQEAVTRVRGSRASEIARLTRCLTCHPPRFRIATACAGIEMQTTMSDEDDVSAQLNLPSSEDPLGSTAYRPASAGSGTLQQCVDSDFPPEDIGTTGTGCCSDDSENRGGNNRLSSSFSPDTRAADETSPTDDEEGIIRQAVQSATQRTFD